MSSEKGFSLNLKKKFCPEKVIKYLTWNTKRRGVNKYEIKVVSGCLEVDSLET